MAEHKIVVTQPAREVVHNDYTFEIFSDGRKLGAFAVSKGTVDWWPRHAKRSYEILWEDFVTLLDGFAADPSALLRAARSAIDEA